MPSISALHAVAWSVAWADVAEIDRLNILQATMLAMRRAFDGLSIRPGEAWIDGDRCPELGCAMRAIVKGDRDVAVISAASILAKTARDAMLVELDGRYPAYGFAHNRGYGTPEHLCRAGAARTLPRASDDLRAGRADELRLLTRGDGAPRHSADAAA